MGNVAIVFTGLVGAAIEHVAQRGPIHPGVACHERFEWNGAEVVGAHAAQRTAVATEGSANGIADKSLVHGDNILHYVFTLASRCSPIFLLGLCQSQGGPNAGSA